MATKTWHTVGGGLWLDPKMHSHEEQTAYVTYRDMVSGDYRGAVERKKMAMALRDAKACGMYDLVLAIAKAQRQGWLDRATMTQRQWQCRTRRPSRARHHDSIAIREKYVRLAR